MKFNLIALLLIILFSQPYLSIAQDKKIKAYVDGLTLKEFKSIVLVEDKNKNKVTPQIDLKLIPGTRVRTGPDSSALLISSKGDSYYLEENSELLISIPLSEKLKQIKSKKQNAFKDKASTMEFLRGRIQTHVKPGQKDQVDIKTSLSVLSIKGTTFTVTIEPTKITLDVLEGQVEMRDLIGKAVEVAAGMRANTQTWKSSQMPKLRREKMDSIHKNSLNKSKQGSNGPQKLDLNIIDTDNSGALNQNNKPKSPEHEFNDSDLDLVSPHHLGETKHQKHHHDDHKDKDHHKDPSRRNPNGIKIGDKPPAGPPQN